MSSLVNPPVSLSEWNHHKYQGIEKSRDGNYVTAETCLLCAGPPMLSQTGGNTLNLGGFEAATEGEDENLTDLTAMPLGLIQGFSLGQNRQHMRIYEIGSWFDYIVSGRNVGQVTVSKMYYSAASLLRVLYGYYGTTGGTETVKINKLFSSPVVAAEALNDIYINPGSERVFANMFSDLFRNPIGLMFIMTTTQSNWIGAFYLERCMVHGHNMAFDAQGVVVQENATISFSRVHPVHIESSSVVAALTNSLSSLAFLGI